MVLYYRVVELRELKFSKPLFWNAYGNQIISVNLMLILLDKVEYSNCNFISGTVHITKIISNNNKTCLLKQMSILINRTIPTATPRATPMPITTSMPAKYKSISYLIYILFALNTISYWGQNDTTILKSKGVFDLLSMLYIP